MIESGGGMFPSQDDCLRLLEIYRVPDHVIQHSSRVCAVAVCLCRLLNRRGHALSEAEVAAASWLHDIAKMDGLQKGENHSLAGARLLTRLGYPGIAEIVRQHVVLDTDAPKEPIGEAAIVHYADKRVRHTEVVSLKARFQDLKERYGKTPEALSWLEDLEEKTRGLEERIFRWISFPPESLGVWLDKENPW